MIDIVSFLRDWKFQRKPASTAGDINRLAKPASHSASAVQPQSAQPAPALLETNMATAPVVSAPVVIKSGFWSKFKSFFLKIFHDLPAWEKFAENSVNLAGPILIDIETLDPVLTPVIAPIMAVVKTDLAVSATLINNVEASTSLTSSLANIQTNLPTILQLSEVKNSSSAAEITTKVSQVSAIINSIQAAVQEVNAPKAQTPAAPTA